MSWLHGQQALENEPIGDALTLPKDPSITRLYFQNLMGVNISEGGTWETVCEHLKHMEVDIAMGCETKLDSNNKYVMKRLHEVARKVFGLNTYTLIAASTPIRSHGVAKPGGTVMQVIGKLKSILQDKGQDYLGRWVYMKFLRSDKSVVTLICTYQVVDVNPQAPSTGPTTYATQLHSQYTGQGRLNPHDLRKHHSDDLVKFVKDCQTRGELIVVAGDLNGVMGDETDGLTRLCSQCDLVDAVLDKHQATNFKTHEEARRSSTISWLTQCCCLPSKLVGMNHSKSESSVTTVEFILMSTPI